MSNGENRYISSQDSTPVIATAGAKDWGLWIFLVVLAVGGVMLYSALSVSEQAQSAPQTAFVPANPNSQITSPPPLVLPRSFLEPEPQPDPIEPAAPTPQIEPIIPQQFVPQYVPPPQPTIEPTPPPPPAIIFEARSDLPPNLGSANDGEVERVTAGRLANPSLTVPKGTIIPAVLETALDSTQPGAVRALVQRDIHSFDGSRVLIQRGSRLYGDYESTLAQGQNRTAIIWGRLLRPDGVMIELESPASDPLGRAGVKGKVDSKFFQRFGGAILQSLLDVGVAVASREAGDGVFVALPGSTQQVTQSVNPEQITPTLRVKHGTSVSVFVSHDLDFASVER